MYRQPSTSQNTRLGTRFTREELKSLRSVRSPAEAAARSDSLSRDLVRQSLEGGSTEYSDSGLKIKGSAKSLHAESDLAKIWAREKGGSKASFSDFEARHLERGSGHGDAYQLPKLGKGALARLRTADRSEVLARNKGAVREALTEVVPRLKYSNAIGTHVVKNVFNAGRLGAGVVGSMAGGAVAGKALEGLGVHLEDLQPAAAGAVMASTGGAVTEAMLARTMGLSFIPKGQNLLRGGLAGGASALVGSLTSSLANLALKDSGLEAGAQSVIAESLAGLTSGASGVALTPVMTSGVGIVGNALADAVGIELALETGVSLGSVGGPMGVAIGALLGLAIGGGMALGQALQPQFEYALAPHRQRMADEAIGRDLVVRSLMADFNAKADFSDSAKGAVSGAIEERVREMEAQGVIRMPDGSAYNFETI